MLGEQRPRICSVPAAKSSLGDEAFELAKSAGLVLDDWERFVLANALRQTKDGSWAAFEVGLVVARQNGKGSILEARELAGLFLLGERYIIHSAHLIDTSLEAFRRLLTLIEDTPELDKQVKRVSNTNGREAIELKDGSRIRFRTRTKGGGRGFSCDCLILDEAMFLPTFAHGALLPTLSARPNPQVWYTGSAVDQLIHDDGLVLSRVRKRGLEKDKRLAYFEWSVDAELTDVDEKLALDSKAWGAANPALGIRITPEHITSEYASMDNRTFAVERLGVGDWPDPDQDRSVIPLEKWDALTDLDSKPADPVCFAFDVSPDRSWATISVASRRGDGLGHVEIVDRRRGAAWVKSRLLDLQKHRPAAFICDGAGSAASLIPELEDEGLSIVVTTAKEHAAACGMLFDAVEEAEVRHLGSGELRSAIKGAVKRPLGDAWAWSRKNSAVDITPLVSSTLAFWGVLTNDRSELIALAW